MANYNSAYTGAEIDENLGFALNGAAKSWASIDQLTTGHPAGDSYNVSSTSDVGEGKTDVNFTNDMANTDYTFTGASAANGRVVGWDGSKFTGYVPAECFNPNTSNDDREIDVILFGDLA